MKLELLVPTLALAGLGLVAALPAAQIEEDDNPDCPILCIDGFTPCGDGWGGCYNVCIPESSPVPPSCSISVFPTAVIPTYSVSETDNCSTRTVCADYINECGMMYGGCFADCTPWPVFEPPPCPSSWDTGIVPPIAAVTSAPGNEPTLLPEPTEDCSTISVCVDNINECGIEYGGCHSICEPQPVYTPPPCPSDY